MAGLIGNYSVLDSHRPKLRISICRLRAISCGFLHSAAESGKSLSTKSLLTFPSQEFPRTRQPEQPYPMSWLPLSMLATRPLPDIREPYTLRVQTGVRRFPPITPLLRAIMACTLLRISRLGPLEVRRSPRPILSPALPEPLQPSRSILRRQL